MVSNTTQILPNGRWRRWGRRCGGSKPLSSQILTLASTRGDRCSLRSSISLSWGTNKISRTLLTSRKGLQVSVGDCGCFFRRLVEVKFFAIIRICESASFWREPNFERTACFWSEYDAEIQSGLVKGVGELGRASKAFLVGNVLIELGSFCFYFVCQPKRDLRPILSNAVVIKALLWWFVAGTCITKLSLLPAICPRLPLWDKLGLTGLFLRTALKGKKKSVRTRKYSSILCWRLLFPLIIN